VGGGGRRVSTAPFSHHSHFCPVPPCPPPTRTLRDAQLLERKTVTQRELYYLHASFFVDQAEAASALLRTQATVGVPRHSLGVLAAGRGWFAGRVRISDEHEAGRMTGAGTDDAMGVGGGASGAAAASSSSSSSSPSSSTAPRPIPADAVCEPIAFVGGGVRFILVVEKECIFRRLVEDRVWDRAGLECVVLTGCGFPDHATRAFLRQLHDALRVPVYGLSDCNPYGLTIMQCFKFGAKSKPATTTRAGRGRGRRGGGGATGATALGDDPFAVPSLRWLGLRHDDIAAHDLPRAALQTTTSRDEARAASLLSDPRAGATDASLAYECERWIEGRSKMELEGILGKGIGYLVEHYLPQKIRELEEGDGEGDGDREGRAALGGGWIEDGADGADEDDMW
jgi:DNA topoisomerase VI subunit A